MSGRSAGFAAALSLSLSGAVWALAGGTPDAGFLAAFGVLPAPFLVFGYTRAAGLDHPTRVRIYNHLLILPGDHFRSIIRILRISLGEGRHHLNILVRNGMVREAKADGRCRYYALGEGPVADRNELFAKHWGYRDLRLRVLFMVRQLGEAKPSAVARSLGISRQLAAYHLAKLVDLGLVRRDG